MACCGQRRAAAVARTAARPAAGGAAASRVAPTPAVAPARASAGEMIRYVAGTPIQVMGPRTGRIYRFSGAAPLQLVANADVPTLLMMSQFRRV